ncbi:uncharacterized protein LOC120166961 [Hibiscus syriacus]|uniref:uncharacterized protein LOC120166961 n=1 Tax=Hibiscus syriacus TaxID=106335 RepID=UPI001921757D|nr:uncharacterized protein LOC120166961 [Hibiscus syriacus]
MRYYAQAISVLQYSHSFLSTRRRGNSCSCNWLVASSHPFLSWSRASQWYSFENLKPIVAPPPPDRVHCCSLVVRLGLLKPTCSPVGALLLSFDRATFTMAARQRCIAMAMAYGGGGFAIGYPLAEALSKMQDRCIQTYPGLYGSDDLVQACMAELGVPLTKEYGFHQREEHCIAFETNTSSLGCSSVASSTLNFGLFSSSFTHSTCPRVHLKISI